MYYELVSDLGNEPITLQLAQDQLRVDSDDDQELIDHYISSARTMFETDTDYILTSQSQVLHLSKWCDDIKITKYPATVTGISYYDVDGNTQSFTDYNVSNEGRVTIISLNSDATFPDLQDGKRDAIQISFTAGYTDLTKIPKDIKQALLMMVNHFYDNRNIVSVGIGMTAVELPLGYERIITRYRNFL